MQITLTPALEAFVQRCVETGGFHSPSEVVHLALEQYADQQTVREARIAAFNQELSRRIQNADRAKMISQEDFERHADELLARLQTTE